MSNLNIENYDKILILLINFIIWCIQDKVKQTSTSINFKNNILVLINNNDPFIAKFEKQKLIIEKYGNINNIIFNALPHRCLLDNEILKQVRKWLNK